MAEVTLFDLARRPKNSCWSLNPWKTRLQLNYKGINYKTEWVEYPELAPKLKALGLGPAAEGAAYTSPTVLFHSDNKAVMDSKAIAAEIEKRYPTPALPVDTPMQKQLEPVFSQMMGCLRPDIVPRVPRTALNPVSKEYFDSTRAERLGMSLEKLEETQGGKQAWEKGEAGLKKIAGLLKETGGPFLDGQQVSFVDFILVGFLRFAEIFNEPLFDWIVKNNPEIGRLYDASKQWLERDDH